MKAVIFDRYGERDVLEIREIACPSPGNGEVLVRVKAAGTNPGEAMIRKGLLESRYPGTFPSGQGTDFAGLVAEVGSGVAAFAVGDEVMGFSHKRSSQAEFVVVPAEQLTSKPQGVSWEVAGSLFVAGTTAYAAVRAVELAAGDVVAVSGAAGGVGTIAVQLAQLAGASVLGIAGPANDQWLSAHEVIPVNYGDDLAGRLRAAAPHAKVDAFLDFFGGGYVEMAIETLQIPPDRINTVIDFEAAKKFPVKKAGSFDAANIGVLAELADLVAQGELEIPIAQAYPLDQVRAAYQQLEERHTRGKIVLLP